MAWRNILLVAAVLGLGSAYFLFASVDSTPPVSQPEPTRDARSARQRQFAFTDDSGVQRMRKPVRGDWLYEHPEPGQTFEEYLRSRPVRAESGQVLAFLPVGEFREDEKAVADATYEIAGLWFGLPVRVMGRANLPREGYQRVRQFDWLPHTTTQYRTDWFLRRLLPPRLPPDAVMLTAVTTGDLYPEDSWNYVFGIASLRRRIGVYSIRRYFPRFWGRPDRPGDRTVALRRAMKLVTHELGHCFGLLHCTAYECGMSGSNSLEESDRRPIHLCPVCLHKLQWNRQFDVLTRYGRLRDFYEAQGLDDEARWTTERISKIESVP